jgi:hypothetical protein
MLAATIIIVTAAIPARVQLRHVERQRYRRCVFSAVVATVAAAVCAFAGAAS